MISVKNVTHFYGSFKALDDISFHVNKGEIMAFLGKNGAGKTTTMRIITGFMAPYSGEVLIDGIDIFEEPKAVKSQIGYLPQLPPLYPELTVKEYLDFVAELKGLRKEKVKQRTDEVIEMTDLGHRRSTLIKYLSRGFKQRVGIAQSIINEPKVLIMDEPTVGLDPEQVRDIRELIIKLAHTENRTIMLSTHILAEASEICERAVIIHDGQIKAVDKIENLRLKSERDFFLTLRVARNKEMCAELLKNQSQVKSCRIEDDFIKLVIKEDVREKIAEMIVKGNYGLMEMQTEKDSLEEAFVKIIH